MRVAAVQLPGRGGTVDERVALATVRVAEAAAAGAQLVVLPEAFVPGYAHAAGEARDVARAWATGEARRHGVVLVTGFLAGGEGGPACFAGVATPDGAWAEYQKRFPSPDEAAVWSPGRRPVTVDTPVGRLGLLVCADALHPSAWAAYRGDVDAVVIVAAWPDYRGRAARVGPARARAAAWLERDGRAHREAWLAKAAQSVGAPVVSANACGAWEAGEGFDGASAVWGADGSARARAVGDGAQVVSADAGGRATPTGALRHDARWTVFLAAYRAAAAVRRAGFWGSRVHAEATGRR